MLLRLLGEELGVVVLAHDRSLIPMREVRDTLLLFVDAFEVLSTSYLFLVLWKLEAAAAVERELADVPVKVLLFLVDYAAVRFEAVAVWNLVA